MGTPKIQWIKRSAGSNSLDFPINKQKNKNNGKRKEKRNKKAP